ncbi:MAG: hypothetical protein IJ281_06015 [Clostridia bacterium]|nr:hypothetical protein [Clostridia bacterium]
MRKYDKLKYSDKIAIRKLINEYNLISTEVFPYTHCKVKIWQDMTDGMYYAYGNIFIHDAENSYDSICGIGQNENDALDDYIYNFLNLILSHEEKLGRKLNDADYGYCDPHDF